MLARRHASCVGTGSDTGQSMDLQRVPSVSLCLCVSLARLRKEYPELGIAAALAVRDFRRVLVHGLAAVFAEAPGPGLCMRASVRTAAGTTNLDLHEQPALENESARLQHLLSWHNRHRAEHGLRGLALHNTLCWGRCHVWENMPGRTGTVACLPCDPGARSFLLHLRCCFLYGANWLPGPRTLPPLHLHAKVARCQHVPNPNSPGTHLRTYPGEWRPLAPRSLVLAEAFHISKEWYWWEVEVWG